MKKSFRIVTALVLILSMFALNVGAMTVGTASEGSVGTNAVCVLQKNLETPVDATGYNYLHAWIYMSNTSIISKTTGNSELEITSSGTCDVEELAWNMRDRDYSDGWNEFYLPLSEATASGGTCNLAAINFVRFYTFTDGSGDATVDVKLANIEFVNEIPLKGGLNIDMRGATNTVENGDGYICEQTAGDLVIFQKVFDTPFSIADYANGFVRFNLFVKNAAIGYADAQIEFTSAGTSDVEETSFRFPQLVNGWNTIYLPVSSAAQKDADLSRINYVRIYFASPASEISIKVTDIAFGTAAQFERNANYDAVNKAISDAQAKLNLAKNRNITYSFATLKALNDAIGAVQEGLYVDEQGKVDAFAAAINNAAAGLRQGASPWLYYLTIANYLQNVNGNPSINFNFAAFLPFLNLSSGLL